MSRHTLKILLVGIYSKPHKYTLHNIMFVFISSKVVTGRDLLHTGSKRDCSSRETLQTVALIAQTSQPGNVASSATHKTAHSEQELDNNIIAWCTGRRYEAKICAVLLPLRCSFAWCHYLPKSNFPVSGRKPWTIIRRFDRN